MSSSITLCCAPLRQHLSPNLELTLFHLAGTEPSGPPVTVSHLYRVESQAYVPTPSLLIGAGVPFFMLCGKCSHPLSGPHSPVSFPLVYVRQSAIAAKTLT